MPSANGPIDEPRNDCRIEQGDQTGAGGDEAHEAGVRLYTSEFHGVGLWDESPAIHLQCTFNMGVVCYLYAVSLDFSRGHEVGYCEVMGTRI